MKKIQYKWIIVGLCFLMVFTCLGFCSSNKSLYLSAITDALNLKRSAFSVSDSLRFISTAVVNLFFGILVKQFGTKKLIGAGFFCLIASAVLYATADRLWLFYLGGFLLGVGLSWTTTTMVGWVVGKWCTEHKGTIMGAVLAANGLGGAVAAQIITPLIYQKGNAFGYRAAYWLVAGILLAVALLILILYREHPDTKEQKIANAPERGAPFSAVRKMPHFYLALICIFFTGMTLQGVNGIAAAVMEDAGLESAYIATVLSVQSLVLAGSKFLTGFLYDKCGLRLTMTICDLSAVSVMLLLAMLTNSPLNRLMAMGYAVFASLALPLETVMLPIFAGDLFGDRAYRQTLGLFVSVNTAGYALGTPLMNLTYDARGSYRPILIVCAVLMVTVTLVFQFILTASKKSKEAIS